MDDDEVIRIMTKVMLEEMGYKVLLAKDGLEAVDLFRQKHTEIDLIILDMIMPVMNGREAYINLREIDRDCKVIISSGFSKNEDLQELIKIGLYGFIRKPYLSSELSQLINDALMGDRS